MSETDLDAGVENTLNGHAAVDTYDYPVVESGNEGPLSEDGARALLTEWVNAEMTAHEKMSEIMRRRAWEPLGYDNPRDMVTKELKGKLINRLTGKPYQRAHLYRIARAAMLQVAIAAELGIEPGDIHISERQLRNVKSDDEAHVVDQVKDAALEKDNEDETGDRADYAQQLVDDVLASEAQSKQPATENTGAASAEHIGTSDSDTSTENSPADFDVADPGDTTAAAAETHTAAPESSWIDGTSGGEPANPAQAPGSTDGVADMAAALAGVQEFDAFRKTLTTIGELDTSLPSVPYVQDKLPEFVDNCLPEELSEFRSQLEKAQNVLTNAPAAVDAMAAVLQVVDEVEDDDL